MANPSIWDLLVLIEAGTPNTLGQATSANSVPVVIASDQPAIPVSGTISIGSGPFAVTQSTNPWLTATPFEETTGSITANGQSITLAVGSARGVCGLLVTGTWIGTIIAQVSVDGTTWVSSEIIPVGSGNLASALTGNGSWHIPMGGLKNVRVTSTAWTSGTANVTLVASTMAPVSEVYCESADNLQSKVYGAVTTAAPSYTTGTTRELSINTSGQLRVDNSGVTQPISGTVTANQGGTWNITNVSGTVSLPTGAATETSLASLLGKFTAATSTLTNVAASASSVTVLALNTSRKSAILYNDSTVTCYVKFGSTASATSFTYLLTAGSTLIIDDSPVYTGIITGIWASATGNMRVTELT